MLLGIDLGTTGVKAMVFDEDGKPAGYGFQEYDIMCSKAGYAEQDAESLWLHTKKVIREAAQETGKYIKGISISVQGDAVIPINSKREALAYAQLGMDYRGTKETEYCNTVLGGKYLFEKTGMRPHPMNSLIKILWVKNNLPQLYERAFKFVTYADFILGKLGSDEIVLDYTMASRTMAFNIHTKMWDQEILSRLDIQQDKLGKAVPSGEIVGVIDKQLAKELGINPAALLVAGGHDQTCAALGAGIVHENMALDSHGTAEVISTVFQKPHVDQAMYKNFYPCYIHTDPDMYFTFALNHTGGVLLKWFVDEFCYEDKETAKAGQNQVYNYLFEKLLEAPSPVLMMPYLNGSGNPTCDLNMKGAFLGLTMTTTRYDIAKSILEAQAFEMKLNIDTLKAANVIIQELRCVGGGARSPEGLQLKANILGIPVSTLQIREAACLGAAMLSGVATGVFEDIKQAAQIVRVDKIYHPQVEMVSLYGERYFLYQSLYETLKQTMHSL